jgi:hypothetical protein
MKPRVAGGECQVTSCTCIVMHLYRMCSSRAGTGSKMNKKPPVGVVRETQRETPENKPSSATAGAPPASGASTCSCFENGRRGGARARARSAGGGEWRGEGEEGRACRGRRMERRGTPHGKRKHGKRKQPKGLGSAGSRAQRRTKATEATGQGARSTSARVGHHANVERGARREQDTSCARGGSRDAGRRHLTPVIRTKKGGDKLQKRVPAAATRGGGGVPHLRGGARSRRLHSAARRRRARVRALSPPSRHLSRFG